MSYYKRYVEKRNGENVIPLRNAICGIDMPKWELRTANDNEMFLSGEAVDRLAELEDKLEDGRLWEAKYLEPRPNPFECAERWGELWFEANSKLNELKEKIENGTLVELDESLIGKGIIGIHHFTDGTYQLDLDENIVVGFGVNGIVTWNNDHSFNDYFKNGFWFIDNDKGRAEAEAKLRELQEK